MKNSLQFVQSFFGLVVLAGLFQGCLQDKCENTYRYTVYEPVYMTYDALRDAVASEAPRDLKNPGKIYVKDNYLFVNEVDKGIHVYDNTDPSNPTPVSFINIPGNVDLSIKGSVLYADSYMDLVVIDINDPANVNEINRVEDVFPPRQYTFNNTYDPTQGVPIDWVATEKEDVYDCNIYRGGGPIFTMDQSGGGPVLASGGVNSTSTGGGGGETPATAGLGGSMARFSIVGDYLYTIDNNMMHLFDITSNGAPSNPTDINIGFGIETIFAYNGMLFIGAQNGMHIYDNSNPQNPVKLSTYAHINSCDPVVVEGTHAFVTLRSGNACAGYTDQLDVVDISNPSSPFNVKTYPMHNPFGLGIENGILMICDGTEGLKVYDANDVTNIGQNQLDHVEGFTTYDVIPVGWWQVAIVTGPDGIYQFDYTDPSNMTQLSKIAIVQ